eukprot:7153916-Pyramimonas_sp.AAC.2
MSQPEHAEPTVTLPSVDMASKPLLNVSMSALLEPRFIADNILEASLSSGAGGGEVSRRAAEQSAASNRGLGRGGKTGK